MRTSEILKEAKALLTEETWTKGETARNPAGRAVEPASAEAKCFCAVGALERIAATHGVSIAARPSILGTVQSTVVDYTDGYFCCVADLNDDPETELSHIHEVFDLAIKKAEEEETEYDEG